jgi:hypothetical protein
MNIEASKLLVEKYFTAALLPVIGSETNPTVEDPPVAISRLG